jgi:archaellum component FlaF (FlaF/FlaG flagellin family)
MYDEAIDYVEPNLSISTGGESIVEFAEINRNPDGSTQMKLSYKRILVNGEYIIVHMQGDLGVK